MSDTVRTLFGLACPSCGSDSCLQVLIEVWADLGDAGPKPDDHYHWDESSSCRCANCHLDGAVETFRTPADPDPLKTFEVTFSEDVSYRAIVRARDAETARTLIQNQLHEGGVDSLEETHNCRSTFEVEEVLS